LSQASIEKENQPMSERPQKPAARAPEAHQAVEEEEEEAHELPWGALLITLSYLALLTTLWLQVYLQLLTSGGIPRQ
jgi:hypothetical protein